MVASWRFELSECFLLHGGTRNTLDRDQSNYSSRIVFSHIPIEFGHTGISAIRSADLENPTLEPNMKWIGRPLAEIWPFEIFPNVRSSVGRQYTVLRLISYTPLRYVRDVAREELKHSNRYNGTASSCHGTTLNAVSCTVAPLRNTHERHQI